MQYQLQWNRQAYAVPGPLGIFARVRGAPVLAPQVTPPTVQTQYSYRPNYITQQVAKTSYVPEVQQTQVPVQVQRMETEVVSEQVPIQVQRMETEVVTEKVPVQTTRMVAETEVRKIPYEVQRPVTETVTRKVPVQKTRYVTEQRVRRVPVRTTEWVTETRTEPVKVRYCEYEQMTRTVRRPVVRKKWIPYEETVYVPRQVVERTPLSYSDPFSPAIVEGYSSFPDDDVTAGRQPITEEETEDDRGKDRRDENRSGRNRQNGQRRKRRGRKRRCQNDA